MNMLDREAINIVSSCRICTQGVTRLINCKICYYTQGVTRLMKNEKVHSEHDFKNIIAEIIQQKNGHVKFFFFEFS